MTPDISASLEALRIRLEGVGPKLWGWWLRFGDPRKVATSKIHDPNYDDYAEEPALYAFVPDEGPPMQRYEQGVSVYPVLQTKPDVVFSVPVGLRVFSNQMAGFLLNRVMEDSVWLFRAQRIYGVVGTDGEPLVAAKTVADVRKISASEIYVTDRETAAGARRLLDLLDPWEIKSHHDMGYDEFFKRRVSLKELQAYMARLRAMFVTAPQQKALDAVEEMWTAQWHEDHPDNPRA